MLKWSKQEKLLKGQIVRTVKKKQIKKQLKPSKNKFKLLQTKNVQTVNFFLLKLLNAKFLKQTKCKKI